MSYRSPVVPLKVAYKHGKSAINAEWASHINSKAVLIVELRFSNICTWSSLGYHLEGLGQRSVSSFISLSYEEAKDISTCWPVYSFYFTYFLYRIRLLVFQWYNPDPIHLNLNVFWLRKNASITISRKILNSLCTGAKGKSSLNMLNKFRMYWIYTRDQLTSPFFHYEAS